MGHFFRLSGLLSDVECQAVRRAMDVGQVEVAEVLGPSVGAQPTVRQAQLIDLDEITLGLVEGRLDKVRDDVAEHFGSTLTGREGAGFLRYRAGGFYRRHIDWAPSSAFPDAAARQVTVVVFLGSASDDDPDADFAGGTLRLHVRSGKPIDIAPRRGELVAFPATVPHEVLPVRRGVRDTVVDWFR